MVPAFGKRTGVRDIDENTFDQVVFSFESDIPLYDMIEIDETIKMRAVELLKSIGTHRGLKTLDALQLSCAICEAENETIDCFIVSDVALGQIAENQGLNVHTV